MSIWLFHCAHIQYGHRCSTNLLPVHHLVQCMKNKLVKWGFKCWIIANTAGYAVNFDLYTGRENDVQNWLILKCRHEVEQTLFFQGYRLYVDNFYSSPQLFTITFHLGCEFFFTLVLRKMCIRGNTN